MIEFTSQQLYTVLTAFFWPFVRILGIFTSAPLFSHKSIPVQVRVGLAVGITFLVAPVLQPFVEHEPLSWSGLLILVQQFVIGIAIGFVMQLVFAGVDFAGQLIAMSMGIGFASFFDPQTQGQTPGISQFLTLIATLLFIGQDFHLLLIESLADSFNSLPVGIEGLTRNTLQQLASWGGDVFSIGLQLALPIITALLIANMALAILTRAAPQLNIFGIGFPVTLTVGYLMIYFSIPFMEMPITHILSSGLDLVKRLTP